MRENQKSLIAYAFPKCIIILRDNDPQIPKVETVFERCGRMKKRLCTRLIKTAERHYMETGLWGCYDTAGIAGEKLNGKEVLLFDDTELKEEQEQLCLERRMIVDGKKFDICSVFPKEAAATPTDKLLSLIDKELEAERNSL